MEKSSIDLLNELRDISDFKEFFLENRSQMAETTLSEYLNSIIKKKNLNKSELIKKSEISETYAYQIISGIKKTPSREKVLSLSLGAGLSFEETQNLLKSTGYAPLYVKNLFDSIIIFGLFRGLSVMEVNDLLFEYAGRTI